MNFDWLVQNYKCANYSTNVIFRKGSFCLSSLGTYNDISIVLSLKIPETLKCKLKKCKLNYRRKGYILHKVGNISYFQPFFHPLGRNCRHYTLNQLPSCIYYVCMFVHVCVCVQPYVLSFHALVLLNSIWLNIVKIIGQWLQPFFG